jgi:hypothetical protein
MPQPLLIQAVVSKAERAALVAAFEQLCECLGAASGIAWPVKLDFRPSLSAVDLSATIVIASLMPELARDDEPVPQIVRRWRENVSPLIAATIPAVFVCTVFRCIANYPVLSRPEELTLIERIRRLNLVVVELSHETGAMVIDIDRIFAHLGARALRTNYLLNGPEAAEVAGHAIVSNILSAGLDDFIPFEVQQRAKQFQGDLPRGALPDIGAFIQRRLTVKAARAGANASG